MISSIHGVRRRTVLKFIAAGSASSVSLLHAQSFPTKPIRVIVGAPPGGAVDGVFRVMALQASQVLGQPLVVENRPGGQGTLSIVQMKNAPADGHTLALLTIAVYRQPFLEDVAYDALKDITYIAGLSEVPFGIAVKSELPFKTWADLVAFGKAKPKEVNYGASFGIGNSAHMLMEEISGKEGVTWNVIPYKGDPDNMTALIGGEIQFAVVGSGSYGLVEAGRARLLAMATPERSKRWPNVPTTRELGYGVSIDSPWGLGGPKGMPPAVVDRIQSAFAKALNTPEVQKALQTAGQEARFLDSGQYTKYAERTVVEQRGLLTKYGLAKKS